jgi:hypothetical protein
MKPFLKFDGFRLNVGLQQGETPLSFSSSDFEVAKQGNYDDSYFVYP